MKNLLLLIISLTVLLLLGACDTDDSGVVFTEVQLNTDYPNQSIGSFSERYYTFVSGASAAHTIAVTNLQSDMSWDLYDNRTDAELFSNNIVIFSDDSLTTGDEIKAISLTPGTQYFLVVFEQDDSGSSSFDLRISN